MNVEQLKKKIAEIQGVEDVTDFSASVVDLLSEAIEGKDMLEILTSKLDQLNK